MITSTDGQSPYHAIVGSASSSPPQELALTAPPADRDKTEAATGTEGDFSFFGDDGFTFGDLIDVVNPLQHIPLISTMYRGASEDDIAAGPRMMGATLFFGPIGLASAVVNVMIEEGTGKDIGEHLTSAFFPVEADETESETAGISSFETAAGSQAPAVEDVDPVSAWAAGEMAWLKTQQATKPEVSRAPAKSAMPDADHFMRGRDDELATLTPRAAADAARAASWAYQSTADLTLSGA